MSIYGNSNDPNQQFNASLKALQDTDAAMRRGIGVQRQVENTQSPDDEVPAIKQPAGGLDLGDSPTAAAPAPAAPAGPTPPTVIDPKTPVFTAPADSNAVLVSESNKRLSAMKNATPAERPLPPSTVASGGPPTDLKRLQALQRAAGASWGAGPASAPMVSSAPAPAPVSTAVAPRIPVTAIADEEARLKKLQAQGGSYDRYQPGAGAGGPPNRITPGTADAAMNEAVLSGGQAPARNAPAGASTYDPIIQQAAQQYGLDPGLLKRLLVSESSLNPTAVSPRGKSFGYGIAQIAASHGLSDAQMSDPRIAIPFAANLLSGYLNKTGGDMNAALQLYKGASSDAGKAAMAGPISKVTAGAPVPAQAAAQPQPAAPQQAAAQPAAAGPTFLGPGGSFTMPQQYTDQTVATLGQQASTAAQQARLAQMRAQANPEDPALGQQLMAAQQQAGQLKQGYYDAQVYRAMQAAQTGNMQAFKLLLQESSNKHGEPIQVVPVGNDQYALRSQNGTTIGQGTLHNLAGAMGFALNRGAQDESLRLQRLAAETNIKFAPEMQKAIYEGNIKLMNQAGINSTQMYDAALAANKLTFSRIGPSGELFASFNGNVFRVNNVPGKLGEITSTQVAGIK